MQESEKKKIADVLNAGGNVAFAGIFGSRATGKARPDSDLDVLIKLKEPVGLLKLIALKHKLSAALGIPVDLVTEGALDPSLRKEILRDLVPIYGERLALH